MHFRSAYRALDDERNALSSGLAAARSVVFRADVASCVPAADLLTIQKHIVSSMAFTNIWRGLVVHALQIGRLRKLMLFSRMFSLVL